MLKRLITNLMVLPLFIFLLWLGWGWFAVNSAQQQLQQFLLDNFHNDALNSMDAELLEYKPNLIGANARIRLSSKVEFLQQEIGDTEANVRLFYGPVFFDDGKLSFGKMMWKLKLFRRGNAPIQLKEDDSSLITQLFHTKKPILSIKRDFDNKISYHSHIKSLSNSTFNIADLLLDGEISPNGLNNMLKIQLRKSSVVLDNGIIEIPATEFHVAISKDRLEQSKHIKVLSSPFVIGLYGESDSVTKRKVVESRIDIKNSELSGYFNVFNEDKIARLEVVFNKLSLQGYQRFMMTQTQIFDLQQQVEWTLEENAETPEGQKSIWHFYQEIDVLKQQLPVIVTQHLFPDKESKLRIDVELAKETEQDSVLAQGQDYINQLSEKGLFNQIDHHYALEMAPINGELRLNGGSIEELVNDESQRN